MDKPNEPTIPVALVPVVDPLSFVDALACHCDNGYGGGAGGTCQCQSQAGGGGGS